MCEIVNENCYTHIKSIADCSIDLIITDPPYLIPNVSNSAPKKKDGGEVRAYRAMLERGESFTLGFDLRLIDEFSRIQPFLNAYIFCNAKLLQELMSYFHKKGIDCLEVLVWHKPNPVPLNKYSYYPDMEYILFVCENKASLDFSECGAWKLFSLANNYTRYTSHPTEKPLSIIEALMRNSSREGQRVYDPFCGSGTIAHVAKMLNRHFIGSEINKEYYQMATQRVESCVNGLLF